MKVSERGQVTIPKKLRDRYGLNAEVEIDFVPDEDGIRIIKRAAASHPIREVFGILNRPSEVDTYIEEIRGR
ncbi:MAG: AbrB/MazE/SpoVT family DNA-binding domain-containing protein [Deltaproteobacteria bacterium]|nr:AbrB/MazE/SpoVT family DNA-binding domain-containing protein [Deltaproteobacteria bacterium]